jgi:hypothetical protein
MKLQLHPSLLFYDWIAARIVDENTNTFSNNVKLFLIMWPRIRRNTFIRSQVSYFLVPCHYRRKFNYSHMMTYYSAKKPDNKITGQGSLERMSV